MKNLKHTLGFGFDEKSTQHHFIVDIPVRGNGNEVSVYECFNWPDTENNYYENKVVVDLDLWNTVLAKPVAREFNEHLKSIGCISGKWIAGRIPVERSFGKELVLLLWAVSGYDSGSAQRALRNWMSLTHEERWWLYTMTNATGKKYNDNHRWWRKAVSYALCEDPVSPIDDEKLPLVLEKKNGGNHHDTK